jgi:hypothetical protein
MGNTIGNTRNRKRKKARISPKLNAKKFKDGEPCDQNPGPSKAKIGGIRGKFGKNPGHTD